AEGKPADDVVRDQGREIGPRASVLAEVVGLPDAVGHVPGTTVGLAGNVAQDGACHVEPDGARARMTRGPHGGLYMAALPAGRLLALAHNADCLAAQVGGDAVHEDD